jgi:hypothetical protein
VKRVKITLYKNTIKSEVAKLISLLFEFNKNEKIPGFFKSKKSGNRVL